MTTVDDLPNELNLLIIPLVPLKSLIALRGTARRWRTLVSQAHIDPSRAKMLAFYLRLIHTPAFLESRADILPYLRPFGLAEREAFLRSLPGTLPDEFKLWVQEWPGRAAFGRIWPGLYQDQELARCAGFDISTQESGQDSSTRSSSPGWITGGALNFLSLRPPPIKCLTFRVRKSHLHNLGTCSEAFPSAGETLHATTVLPVGVVLPERDADHPMYWFNEEEEETVSIEITALGVRKHDEAEVSFLNLNGKGGGEKLAGVVLRFRGYGVKWEDVEAKSWFEYLEMDLCRQEKALDEQTSGHT